MSPTALEAPRAASSGPTAGTAIPQARRQLLQGIADAGVRDVVVLGGDVHRYVAADLRVVPNDPASPVVASEFVGGSISSRGASRTSMDCAAARQPGRAPCARRRARLCA